ncbi:MAG TPA: DsbA family oxidoreductase [Devosia sp.]|nr:DsbA family oxidoreductase [Devosia sp.]
MRHAHIDIFSDPACPWCLVGMARLDKVLGTLGDGAQVDITHHPFLLDFDTPKEGEDVVELLTRKYGHPPDEMWQHLEEQAKLCGLEVDMHKQKRRNPSQKALALIMAAKEKGTQHALARAVSHACYLDGLNIFDDAVLLPIAMEHGFDEAEALALLGDDAAIKEVEKNARWAPQAGIKGVPYFIFNNKFALSGAQPESVFEAALEKALSMVRVPD